MLRNLFQLISPTGARGRLSILIFHRVLPKPDPLFPEEIDAERFDRLCGWIKQWFQVLPLNRAMQDLETGRLPARALSITFDDGYADNHDVALPILQRHGLSATFYIATGFLDGGRMWNDSVIESVRQSKLPVLDMEGSFASALGRFDLGSVALRRAAIDKVIGSIKYKPIEERSAWVQAVAERSGAPLPSNLMMTSAQVKALHRAGMQIGAHTVSHPILARLSRDEARREIAGSKESLEHLLGERVGLFAYPNGKPGADYNDDSVAIVRELGFDSAVSTAWGAARQTVDRFQIPRFTPWDRTRLRFGARLLRNLWSS